MRRNGALSSCGITGLRNAGGMYRNSLSACARETVQYTPALSAGAFVRLNHAPQLPRETRFARPGDRRAAKHRRLRSLRAKVARRFRHYSLEGRCALAIQRAGESAAMDHPRWPTAAFLLPPPGLVRKNPNY